jgi:biotin synthase
MESSFLYNLAEKALHNNGIAKEEALKVLQTSDDTLLELVQAAFLLRKKFFGRAVRLHVIRNAKSGFCSEDCAFCSQSAKSKADIPKYPLQEQSDIIKGALRADRDGAFRYCIVLSGRDSSEKALTAICNTAREIKKRAAHLELCVSAGIVSLEDALLLKKSGVDRINHNLETSERYFPKICTTHSFDDRIETAKNIKRAGLALCCGGLIGMGETFEDRVELAFALKDVGSDSIPVNFLNPREGTPLEKLQRLSPQECLRALAMFRFVNPDKEIRAAGGREACIGSMQPLALYIANSIFINGYLTTQGQGRHADIAMIEDAGFYVENWTSSSEHF